MPPQTLYTSSGKTFRRGNFIAKGGEGEVYAIQNQSHLIAKLYFANRLFDKEEKIQKMIPLCQENLRKFAALPIESLYDSKNNFVGFLMDFVKAEKLPYVYWAKERNETFPKARWNFLIRIAANIARAVHALHQYGFIVGDINESNVLVFSDKEQYGTVKFIDCDSFQFQSNSRRFLCNVFKSQYIAPELQGQDLTVWREPQHDNFALAVLIFQILFLGRHPFSGIYVGNKHFTIEQSIKEHRFAFGADSKSRGYLPPPYITNLEEVSTPIEQLFRRAFLQNNSRPTAKDWADSLENLEKSLTVCEENNGHYYPNSLTQCPWCRIEIESQWKVIHFEPKSFDTSFNIDEIWQKILSIKTPPKPLALPDRTFYELLGWQKIKAQINFYSVIKLATAIVILLGFLGVTIFLLSLKEESLILPIIIVGIICWVIIFVTSNPQRFIPKEILQQKKSAELNYLRLADNYTKQNATQLFFLKLNELRSKKAEYSNLGLFRAQRIQELEKQARVRQEVEFLSKHHIANASIPNIGYSRTLTLRTYGIETAADISEQRIYSIPGFGFSLTYDLVSWKETIKSKFKFKQHLAITESDKHALEREIHRKRISLEKELKNGLRFLQQLDSQAESTSQSIYQNFKNNLEILIALEYKFAPNILKWLKLTTLFYVLIVFCISLSITIIRRENVKTNNASLTNQSSNNLTRITNLNYENRSAINENLQENSLSNTNSQDSESIASYKQGVLLTRAGRFNEAVLSYQKAIELNPKYAEAYHELGYALFKLGKYSESLEASIEATKLRPKFADTYRNLGDTYKALNQIDSACDSFNKAKNLTPKHIQTISKLASCYVQQGNSNEAIKTYNDLIKIQPQNAAAHYELGKLYKSMGRSEEAMDEYRNLLTLDRSLADKLLREIEQ